MMTLINLDRDKITLISFKSFQLIYLRCFYLNKG